jgi:hypothetical protein
MRSSYRRSWYAVAALGVGALAGCADRLPTLSGDERFPAGLIPLSVELVLQAPRFLHQVDVFSGETGPAQAPFLLTARDFDGALHANTLVRFEPIPDTLVIDFVPDAEYTFAESRMIAAVRDSLAVSAPTVTFHLWEVTQPWDSATTSWEFAVDRPGQRVPWQTPGGTRGQLLSTTSWTRALGDTITWNLTVEQVTRIARGQIEGVMVTVQDEGVRAELLPLTVEARIRASVSDTIVTRFFSSHAQTFVFTPEPPTADNVLRVGGITSDRTYLRLGLEPTLPACPGVPDPGCPRVPLSEVTLNRVELLLDPVRVPLGFRPLVGFFQTVRRILEPELGRRAPLGPVAAFDSIPAVRFETGGAPFAVNLTPAVMAAVAGGRDEIHLMLLQEPEASSFGYAWFERNPRMRFIYTVHQRPQLP